MKSTQKKRNVHGQRKIFALPDARDTNMLVLLALGDAKVPNVNGFMAQWNIGLSVKIPTGLFGVIQILLQDFPYNRYDAFSLIRDWSLITGRGGYKMGKSRVQKILRPPLKTR